MVWVFAGAFGLSLAYRIEEHPILQKYTLEEVVERIERTLRFESNARGEVQGYSQN